MHRHESETLGMISKKLHAVFGERLVAVYAFGSRVRGDYDADSDFDVLVLVKDKNPDIEYEIISIFVDLEMAAGLSFTPVIKDIKTFEMEKAYHTPFYENIMHEGVLV